MTVLRHAQFNSVLGDASKEQQSRQTRPPPPSPREPGQPGAPGYEPPPPEPVGDQVEGEGDGLSAVGELEMCLRAAGQMLHIQRFARTQPEDDCATVTRLCLATGLILFAYKAELEAGGDPNQATHDEIARGLAEIVPLHFMFEGIAEGAI